MADAYKKIDVRNVVEMYLWHARALNFGEKRECATLWLLLFNKQCCTFESNLPLDVKYVAPLSDGNNFILNSPLEKGTILK